VNVAADHLYQLLPSVYRERDAANGEVLRQYLEVLTDELAVVADGIDQLYDDLFVETAGPWVLPYIAELIGLHGVASGTGGGLTPRAEVANTIAYRRRKGTAAVLEQLARDTTGWPARAVEYFELLASCQHMNHVRPNNQVTVNVRDANRLEFVGTAFERGSSGLPGDLIHLAEMRRIPSRRGRYNIPNVGIFLWRLRAYPLTEVEALPVVPGDQHRFLLNRLGAAVQLFGSPLSETEITHLAEPINVPMPLSRRFLSAQLHSYYGRGLSLLVDDLPIDVVDVSDLSDLPDGSGDWNHTPVPAGRLRLDPVLGRIAFGDPQASPPRVSFHYGFSADIGGGEYERTSSFALIDGPVERVARDGSEEHSAIQPALDSLLAASGTVEIADNARFEETLAIAADATAVEVRAADSRVPVIVLDSDLEVTLADGAEVFLNGIVIAGGAIHVAGSGRLILRHCTLVPGLTLNPDGSPAQPGVPSLFVETGDLEVSIERSILGGVRAHVDSQVALVDSIVDAGEGGVAFASAPDGSGPAGTLTLDECTVFGLVHARVLQRASNCIFMARVPEGQAARWPGPVLVDRRQEGCVRFSYLPARARTPRRFECVPQSDSEAEELRPVFTSTRYGDPAFAQLDRRTPDEVWRGADDESEMGAFHYLRQPLREAYLTHRLQEYLRFGLEAGLFFAT
jgi:hypothetical protein